MINESNATPHSRDEWTQQYAVAQRLKEDVQQFNVRWQHYALPVQALLTTLLTRFGLEAAALVTTAIERQEHRRQMMLTLTRPSTVLAHRRGISCIRFPIHSAEERVV